MSDQPATSAVEVATEGTSAMPFQVVPSSTSIDLSGSVYVASSGSNMDTSVAPASAFGPTQGGASINLTKWEQYIQQNNLLVNIDPSMVESYVQAGLDADRAHIEALAHANSCAGGAEAAPEDKIDRTRCHLCAGRSCRLRLGCGAARALNWYA